MSPAASPRVHVERFAVGSDAIDANRHVNNKEYLHWMEAIAIAHSAACGWTLERYVAAGTSWYVRSHSVDYLTPAFEDDRLVAATAQTAGQIADVFRDEGHVIQSMFVQHRLG